MEETHYGLRKIHHKYATEHGGKAGVAKADVLQIIMDYGGSIDDVRAVMIECLQKIAPRILSCKH